MRKTQEKIILHVLGEEEHSFLGTGRAQVETFAGEGSKELFPTFRISALYTGDSLGVITTADKMFDRFRTWEYPLLYAFIQ